MTRRFLFAAAFAAVALSSTGCCGVVRNFVYRIRHCNGCYPAFGGYHADAPIASPGYSGAAFHPAPIADAGCATCGSSPVVPYHSAGVPVVPPGYPVQPGAGVPFGYPEANGKMAGTK